MNTIENQTALSYEHVIVDRSQLNPGRIVEVRKPQTIDDFFQHVAGVIRGKPVFYLRIVNSGVGRSGKTNFYPDIESVVKASAKRVHNHHGSLDNSTVLVIPDDDFLISKLISKLVPIQGDVLGRQKAANFLIATQIFSSGRKDRVLYVVNEALLCPDENGEEFWVNIRDLNKDTIRWYIETWV